MALDKKIIEAVEFIGRSELKLAIFKEVYYHKSRIKSVDEIAVSVGLTREQVLKNGVALKKAGLFDQEKKDGVTAYKQIEFYQHNKDKIVRFVADPSKMEKFTSSSPPVVSAAGGLSFVRPRMPHPQKSKPSREGKSSAKLRIAFLTTNPVRDAALRTDMEMRDVLKELKKSPNRDYVEVRHLPAARLEDLLDALNEFKPNVIHFSGHGGDSAVLFDNRDVDEDGGVELDFGVVQETIDATHSPPDLLVFNACDTVVGADVFLKTVRAVVAMSDSITDSAATLFSTRFYAALASGQSIGDALKQGKVVLKAAKLADDADLPTLIVRKGLSQESLKFL
ncbi:CHAT domain-containing protein [Hyphomicrobium sp.]|uniref:CHAT domain-containing protein n=1 Tax=Hyphomicrobium sp. TaxID=82 RepID=UPI0025C02DF7|nr:CHAT domain-containing protein [Hyphomicrobium sp.]